MCDIAVVVRPEGVLFAKNSDRDANEAQLLEWHPRREGTRGPRLRCTWIEIEEAPLCHAVLLSKIRPQLYLTFSCPCGQLKGLSSHRQ